MDDLANELSYTMIDEETEQAGNELSKLTVSKSVCIGNGVCGGEASAEGSAHEQPDTRGRLQTRGAIKELDALPCSSSTLPLIERSNFNSPRRCRVGSYSKPSSTRLTKPVARTASILLRSKVLILSDSETDDEDSSLRSDKSGGQEPQAGSSLRRKKVKKHKRKKPDKQGLIAGNPFGNLNQCSGKRKRSTTISFTLSGESAGGPGGDPMQTTSDGLAQSMECEAYDYSSSISESSVNSDIERPFEEADDEQSDFYEVISKTSSHNKGKSSKGHHHRPPMAKNPFALVTASESSTPSSSFTSGSSALLWKRRRRNQWP